MKIVSTTVSSVHIETKLTWELEEEVYPTTSIMPNDIELFGITDVTKAKQMAKYFWKQGQARKMTSFL